MKKIIVLLFCLLIFQIQQSSARSAITYKLNGGRFGDKIILYARAKWLSLQYDIPLYSRAMGFGDNLVVDVTEKRYSKKIEKDFDTVEYVAYQKNPKIDPDANILYVLDWHNTITIDWKDKKFLSIMKSLIAPNYDIDYVVLPEDAVSVAIHVRTGGGYTLDTLYMKRRHPLKFPSLDFYLHELRRVIDVYSDQKLYVHIFTDDQHPEKIVDYFKQNIQFNHIEYGYRTQGNSHDTHVLDDFFNMMRFNTIIFPYSGLSIFAFTLGDQKVGIMPVKHKFISKYKWLITKVSVCNRDKDGNTFLRIEDCEEI